MTSQTLAWHFAPLVSAEGPGIGYRARQRRGRGDGRIREVDLGLGTAHPSRVVPIARGERALAWTEHAVLASEAWAAAGVHDERAGLHEGLNVAARQCLHVDLLGGGDHDRSGAGAHLAALEIAGDDRQIFDTAVGAAAHEHLVELGA